MQTRWRDFFLSLPERSLRSVTALAGGLLREVGDVALPKTIRRSQLYRNLVEATLRFMIEQVGQVEGEEPFLAPEPSHGLQLTSVGTRIFTDVPRTASSRFSSRV